MSRRIRTGLTFVSVAALLVALMVGYAKRAVQQVQPFYAAALQADPEALQGASREMESRVAALYSDVVGQENWQTAFSEHEVNGWLAVALKEKYADLISENVSDPRVAFADDAVLIGFRYRDGSIDTVLSVRVDAFVSDEDQLAIRLRKAHAGTLPLPLAKIVEPLTRWARDNEIPLRWTQQAGSPVALVPLQGILSTDDERRQLATIELHQGELVLAGKTIGPELSVAEKADDTIER